MKTRLTRILALAAVALFLAACAGQTRKAEPEETGATTQGAIDMDHPETWTLDNPESPVYKKTVHFDFDRSDIKPEEQDLVVAHGRYLAAHPNAHATLEGHADERGTREYNLALGERRAQSVAQLMMAQGASRAQIQETSYGEEQPVATCHDESCWWQNRRVEILYSSN